MRRRLEANTRTAALADRAARRSSAPRHGWRSRRSAWMNWSSACRARCADRLAAHRANGCCWLTARSRLWQVEPGDRAWRQQLLRHGGTAARESWRAAAPRPAAVARASAAAAGAHLERRQPARDSGSRLRHRQRRRAARSCAMPRTPRRVRIIEARLATGRIRAKVEEIVIRACARTAVRSRCCVTPCRRCASALWSCRARVPCRAA